MPFLIKNDVISKISQDLQFEKELKTCLKILLQISVNILQNLNGVSSHLKNDTSQLAIFVRGNDSTFNVTEELGWMTTMSGSTTGSPVKIYNPTGVGCTKITVG